MVLAPNSRITPLKHSYREGYIRFGPAKPKNVYFVYFHMTRDKFYFHESGCFSKNFQHVKKGAEKENQKKKNTEQMPNNHMKMMLKMKIKVYISPLTQINTDSISAEISK